MPQDPESFEEKRKKQQLFIVAFVGIVFVTLVVLYVGLFRAGDIPAIIPGGGQNLQGGDTVTLEPIIKPKNLGALIDRLRDLRPHGLFPLSPGQQGRPNPFNPY